MKQLKTSKKPGTYHYLMDHNRNFVEVSDAQYHRASKRKFLPNKIVHHVYYTGREVFDFDCVELSPKELSDFFDQIGYKLSNS